MIVCIVPWLILYGYVRYKGVANPEIDGRCVRGALVGTAFFIGFILFYLHKIRGALEEKLCEAGKVAKTENC